MYKGQHGFPGQATSMSAFSSSPYAQQVEDENTVRAVFKPRQAYCPLYTEGIYVKWQSAME